MKFSIFTPTYNRVHTLHNVFNSLMQQTFKDFEWLIVDDGSTDNTQKAVEEYKGNSWFPIRYIYQENGGKHRAINRGVQEAKGEFFLILDSDDSCVDNALERFDFHWKNIEAGKKEEFASIAALSIDQKGQVVGDKFPEDIFDSNWNDIKFKYNIKGDKWLLLKTDILKKYSFPEFEGERFIAESSIWNEIAKRYQTRCINEALHIHVYLPDGLTAKTVKLRKENPLGAMFVYENQMLLDIPSKYKVKALVNYIRFSLYSKKTFIRCVKKIIDSSTGKELGSIQKCKDSL